MNGILMIPLLFVCQPKFDGGWEELAAETVKNQELLTKRLEDDKLWTDPKNQKELLTCLKAANLLPDTKRAQILLKRLSFRFPGNRDPFEAPEIASPVFGALVSIGLPAIPPAIDLLKKTPSGEDDALRLVGLVRRIYEQAGFGREIAIQRLELELSRTKQADERTNLEDALQRLRPKIDTKGKA